MGILLYLILSFFTLTPQIGFAPLTVRTKVHLDPHFMAGTVCILYESEAESGSDCWTVEDPPIRTWTKYHTLRGQGEWMFAVTQVGQDTQGNVMAVRSPAVKVVVY